MGEPGGGGGLAKPEGGLCRPEGGGLRGLGKSLGGSRELWNCDVVCVCVV